MGPIDVIYPFRQSKFNMIVGKENRELYYSLKSVQKNLKGYRTLWIIGDRPEFFSDPHVPGCLIPANDPYSSKQQNVRRKLLQVAHEPAIAENFILMNDDFFILREVRAESFPVYRSGTIPEHLEWQKPKRAPGDPYMSILRNTLIALQRNNLSLIDFEVHLPMLFRKDVLGHILDSIQFDWSSANGLAFRSLYGNFMKLEGIRTLDVKLGEPQTEEQLVKRVKEFPFLSTGPAAETEIFFNFLKQQLE